MVSYVPRVATVLIIELIVTYELVVIMLLLLFAEKSLASSARRQSVWC
jgi:hypothetical protein